jgi:hypothetical protein
MHNPLSLGKRCRALNLGRSGNSLTDLLQRHDELENQYVLIQQVLEAASNQGLEFVYDWGPKRSFILVATPLAFSTAFIIAWIAIQVKRGQDLQVTIQTAFAVATYIVTMSILTY